MNVTELPSTAAWPAHWRNVPLWALFDRIKDVGHPEEEMLSVYRAYGVIKKSSRDDNTNQTAENREIYQLVDGGWFIVNRMKAWQGSVGISALRGIVSGHYLCFRPKHGEDPHYLNWLLRSSVYAVEYARMSRGVRPGQIEIDNDELRGLRVALPPFGDQRRIAEFLDAETVHIDSLEALRMEQVTRLEERQASWRSRLFSECRSGRWTRVKHLLRVKPRYGVLVPEFVDDGVPFIRVNNISNMSTRDCLATIPSQLSAQYPRTVTVVGDVLLSVVGTMGKAAVVSEELVGANTARAVAVLRLDRRHAPSLFVTWVATAEFEQQARLATGADSAQPTLGMEDLANFAVRWPSDESEQREMAAAAEEQRLEAAAACRALDRQLAILAERRQALITAAVTGQIDVTTARGLSASGGGA